MIRRLFGAARRAQPSYGSVPDGMRVYAIGDVHGRLDLLDDLLARIEEDAAGAAYELVLLGDLVDRGPDSAGVVERVRSLADGPIPTRVLIGNHEEIFLGMLDGDDAMVRLFCRVGGRETAFSYGLTQLEYDGLDFGGLMQRMVEAVPPEHRRFLAGLEDQIVIGDFAFVHAGVRPGVALAEQTQADLRWIRTSFLKHADPFEKMVVHGHTITDAVEFRPNRIGIDTGAYLSGKLTALGLEGDRHWIIQTGA